MRDFLLAEVGFGTNMVQVGMDRSMRSAAAVARMMAAQLFGTGASRRSCSRVQRPARPPGPTSH
jgi:hypothetical protein